MTVIPFDRHRFASDRAGAACQSGLGASAADRLGEDKHGDAQAASPSFGEEHRPASIAGRVDQLERALIATLRENAINWARAERAEQRLAERERREG